MPIAAYPILGSGIPGSTLGYVQSTAGQTGITTETDLTGLTLTINIPAGRRIKVTASVVGRLDTIDQNGQIRIYQDDVEVQFAPFSSNFAGGRQVAERSVILTPSAGTHVYKVTALRDSASGTVSIDAWPSDPNFLLIEDITGAVWPVGSTVTAGMVASEPYTTWVPAVTQSVAVSSTVLTARYIKIGRLVQAYCRINITSAGTTNNSVVISLPVPGFAHGGSGIPIGTGWIYDQSTSTMYEGSFGLLGNGLSVDLATDATGGNDWGVLPNLALASGDIIAFSVTYEAAS